MDLAAFRASRDGDTPPDGLTDPLLALWHAAKGDWRQAHEIAQRAGAAGDSDADWVHAYLHRVEGDTSNAGYWYWRSRQAEAKGPLEEEWAAISTVLLERS